jgi:hypothetical protein
MPCSKAAALDEIYYALAAASRRDDGICQCVFPDVFNPTHGNLVLVAGSKEKHPLAALMALALIRNKVQKDPSGSAYEMTQQLHAYIMDQPNGLYQLHAFLDETMHRFYAIIQVVKYCNTKPTLNSGCFFLQCTSVEQVLPIDDDAVLLISPSSCILFPSFSWSRSRSRSWKTTHRNSKDLIPLPPSSAGIMASIYKEHHVTLSLVCAWQPSESAGRHHINACMLEDWERHHVLHTRTALFKVAHVPYPCVRETCVVSASQ